jgi:hypothetical protein
MKWFQMYSNMPNHGACSRIRTDLGTEGFGALVLLYCYVAQYGSDEEPGLAVDADGEPMSKQIMMDVSTLDEEKFTRLLDIMCTYKLIHPTRWKVDGCLFIKDMRNRSDRYAKRVKAAKRGAATTAAKARARKSTPADLEPLELGDM